MSRSEAEINHLVQLNDLLAETEDIRTVLPAVLRLMAALAARPGGVLAAAVPGGSSERIICSDQVPSAWELQLAEPASPLRQILAAPEATTRLELVPEVAACLPIIVQGRSLGMLLLQGPVCSPAELAGLKAPLAWLGRTLHVAGLDLANQRSREELAALHTIATTLTSSLELDEILNGTMEGIRSILKVAAAALLLLDEQQGELIFKKTLAGEPDWIFQYSLKTGEGLVGESVRTGQVVCVNQVAQDPRFSAELDGVAGFETTSILCAPLITHGRTLGAIEVINRKDGEFTAQDADLLVSVAASVAHAIYNARLFHQLTVANADLEASRWEVLRSRSTLQALFDGITAPIYIVDRDFTLIALNPACAHSAPNAATVPGPDGLSRFLGTRCYATLYGRTEPCAGCRVLDTFREGRSFQRTLRRWEADGQAAEWEMNTYPIRDERGLPVQVIVMSQDVTEKRRLENSLAQSEKLAAMGQLAAGVAHEINNPLAAIIANTQLLQRELPPDDDRQESVDLIARAGERALRVVRNLLDFARQDRFDLSATDVNSTLENALALVDHQLATQSITLSRELAQGLPLIEASRDHLQGVWLNLLLNARDAMNGQAGEIRVSSGRHGNEIHVTVADTGMGIPPEKLTRIFEPFYTTKEPGRGTGLGLAMCHRIVKQHGGYIRVDSRVGQGTLFTVILPIHLPASV